MVVVGTGCLRRRLVERRWRLHRTREAWIATITSLIVISSKKAAKFKEYILERNVYLYEQLEVQSLSVQREAVKIVTSLSWDIFALRQRCHSFLL